MEQLLTVRETAETLNVSRQTVYNWVRCGHLKAVRIGRTLRINPRDLPGQAKDDLAARLVQALDEGGVEGMVAALHGVG